MYPTTALAFFCQNASYDGDFFNNSYSGGQINMQSQASATRPSPQPHLTHSVPTDMSRAQFFNQQQQRGSIPNDYVQLPTGPRTVEQSEDQPLIVEDYQLNPRTLGRYCMHTTM